MMIKDLLPNITHLDRILISIGIVVLIYIVKKIIVCRVNRRIENITARHNARKAIIYLLGLLTVVILGFIWIRKINVGVVFSIIGAGLVISLGDLILSIFGWIFITIGKPFEIGERVQIGEIKGDVVDIRASYVTLLEIEGWVKEEQSTGRIVNIPNNFVFRNPVYNYTKGFNFIWNEIKIPITFESNYKKAKEICDKFLNDFHNSWAKNLERKIKNAQANSAVYYKTLTPKVYVKIGDSGVILGLRYLVEPHKRRFSEDLLCQNILDEFSKNEDINFAYITYRLTK